MPITEQEELQLVTDVILCEYHDSDTYALIAKIRSPMLPQLSPLWDLLNHITNGNWQEARALMESGTSKEFIANKADCISKLDFQNIREIIFSGQDSVHTLQFLKSNFDPNSVAEASKFLVFPELEDPRNLRLSLFKDICTKLGPKEVPQLLLYAKQFREIYELGACSLDAPADTKSYIYLKVSLHFASLCLPEDKVTILRTICMNVKTLWQFTSSSDFNDLMRLIRDCLKFNSVVTVDILRTSQMAAELAPFVEWRILTAEISMLKQPPYFNYLGLFKSAKSMLDLGSKMRSIVKSKSFIGSENGPVFKGFTQIITDSEVWALGASTRYIVVGTCGEVSVLIYGFTTDSMRPVKLGSIANLGNVENIRVSPHLDNRFLVIANNQPYLVSIDGFNIGHTLLYSSPSDHNVHYNDAYWSITDPSSIFYVCEDLFESEVRKYEIQYDGKSFKLPTQPASVVVSGTDIIILAAKTLHIKQVLILLDTKTGKCSTFSLPELPEHLQYTTIRCSTYDPRTIVLLSPPNRIYILDKYGERATRIIYGPKFEKFIMKCEFIGPMDRFLLVTSEEAEEPKAYAYNRFTGELVTTFAHHINMINTITGCLTGTRRPYIITGGDDCGVNIYYDPI